MISFIDFFLVDVWYVVSIQAAETTFVPAYEKLHVVVVSLSKLSKF
jgi:hypothetical protein